MRRFGSRRRDAGTARAAACLVFVAFFALLFWPFLSGDRFILVSDALYYSYPLRAEAWAMLRSGRPPLWTPHILSGYPLLSMAQLGLAYPVTWGYALLPARWAEQLYVLAPYLLAPAFTFAYAREVGRSRLAALLAGLAFGYGGMMLSRFPSSGVMSNAMMWLPLMLVGLERIHRRGAAGGLLLTTAAYALSLLTGIGQGFVYACALSLAYALWLGAACAPAGAARLFNPARWRALWGAAAAVLLAAGVAAFQLLETMRAVRRSVRSALSYESFSEGSFTWRLAARSFVAPFYHSIDVTTAVAPVAAALALCGVALALRGRAAADRRHWFWLGAAAAAWLLMLGSNTPLHRIVYRLPALNLFRVPSRHAFEWTFALAVLAAYGWDACRSAVARRVEASRQRPRAEMAAACCLLAASAAVGVLWWRAVGETPAPASVNYDGLAETSYLAWKLGFTSLLLPALWLGWRASRPSAPATTLLAAAVCVACFAEPYILVSRWWTPFAKPPARLAEASPATRFLRAHAPEQNRVYTRVALYAEQESAAPRLDAANLTALHGLQNVAGIEPLILERYSRALGNVGPDAVAPRPGHAPDPTLFGGRSRVLDLLNARFVVSYENFATRRGTLFERDGIEFDSDDASARVEPTAPGATPAATLLRGTPEEVDTLALVTAMSNSADIPDGTPVVKVLIHASGGRVIERELRAGADTAEWAHERADVRPVIRHSLARVFDSSPGDERGSFRSLRFLARVPFGERVKVERVELFNLTRAAPLSLSKATYYDSASRRSAAVTDIDRASLPAPDPERFRPVYLQDGALVLRNERAQPRAWLVAEAESVDGEEALRRIRGEGSAEFDPRRTALLEVTPDELPQLPGGALAPGSSARVIAYEPARVVVETDSPAPAVLVVSEIFYPGWEASVDGRAAPIHLTDYLLRGVALPAGRHRVEMRYRAPAARNGAIISACTLLGLLAALLLQRRRARAARAPRREGDAG